MNDYAARSDDYAVADTNARAYRHTTTNPTIVADYDWLAGLDRSSALDVVDRVLRCVEAAVGAYLCVRADGDAARVEKRAVLIHERMRSDFNAPSDIAIEGCRYDGRYIHIGYEFVHQLLKPLVATRHCIQPFEFLLTIGKKCLDFR